MIVTAQLGLQLIEAFDTLLGLILVDYVPPVPRVHENGNEVRFGTLLHLPLLL